MANSYYKQSGQRTVFPNGVSAPKAEYTADILERWFSDNKDELLPDYSWRVDEISMVGNGLKNVVVGMGPNEGCTGVYRDEAVLDALVSWTHSSHDRPVERPVLENYLIKTPEAGSL